MEIKIVCISDTHDLHRNLSIPEGDILIHAGDITYFGSSWTLYEFNEYMGSLPHSHKIVIAGNHDFCIADDPKACAAILTNCIYLQDQSVTIEGIKFYGSPWQPWFHDMAFNLQRGPDIKAKWDLIPEDTDVLITHGAPYGHLDTIQGVSQGCQELLTAVDCVKPKLHVFGHIHKGAGLSKNEHTTFINASSCDQWYKLANLPIVFNMQAKEVNIRN
jgi:Icc-related predicted phosphoesterase